MRIAETSAVDIMRSLPYLLLLVLAGCVSDPLPPRFTPLPALADASVVAAHQIAVTFTGTAGIHINNGQSSVLIDPYYSNIPWWHLVWPNKDNPDQKNINQYLPPVENLKAILVSHSHFDHAMDLAYILTVVPEETRIFGSKTLGHMLHAVDSDIEIIEPTVSSEQEQDQEQQQETDWIEISPELRVLPFRSAHAPHVFGHTVSAGRVQENLSEVPDYALAWKAGQVFSFIIEIKSISGTAYRIFYQGSASDFPQGRPSDAALGNGPIDLAIVPVASYRQYDNYPGEILALLNPRAVMLIHWDNFFDGYTSLNPGRGFGLANLDAFDQRISKSIPHSTHVYWPARQARLILSPAAN